jgi:hypothetical protein
MKLSLLGLGCTFVLLGCAHAPASQSPTFPAAAPGADPVAQAPAEAEAAPPIAELQTNPMLDEAMRRYAARDYVGAASAFQAAYAFEASSSLLLAQAQALRLAGNCEAALPLYDRFLETQTDPTYTNAVRPMMETCLDASADSAVARAQ